MIIVSQRKGICKKKIKNEAVAKTQQPALLLIDFYYLSELYSHTVAFAFIQ